MIKLVGFDLDGTIGNTIPLCIKAIKRAVEPYIMGEVSDAEIEQTFGLNEEGMIKQLVGDENWKDALKDFYAVYSEMHDMCPQPFSGILDLIEELKSEAVCIVLITGKGERSCDITLRQFGLEKSFDRIITGNSQRNTKSDAIKTLLRTYKLQPGEMIYIGDTVSDIAACKEAGICCLSAAWANSDEIIPDLEEINPNRVCYSVHLLREFLIH
ncbi:HAD family hydrolase [Bacteroides sp.]|uniref:HAD family hydrolase n=1 Tax=Bacteroides sp. TaxID=29523 RepID=UPI00263085F1|nr:HAD family hydrolase [Bacteroides sp.]